MRRIPVPLVTAIIVTLLLGLMAAFHQVGYAYSDQSPSLQEETPPPPTAESPPEDSKSPDATLTVTPEFEFTPTPTRTPLAAAAQEDEQNSERELFTLEGPLTERISEISAMYGLDTIYFLGLSAEDWINIAVSILFFLAFYFFGRWLLLRVLKQLLKRTPFEADVELLEYIKPQINWFVITLALQLSLARLTFLSS